MRLVLKSDGAHAHLLLDHGQRNVEVTRVAEAQREPLLTSPFATRDRSLRMVEHKLPSGTVTLMFTDIEGSTRLIEELGEVGYVQALTEHRSLLRSAFASHGGIGEVDTQGDAPVRAADYFRRSLVFATQVEATHHIAVLALGLGAGLVAERDEQRGVQLLGAAESLREELDMTFNDALEERIHEQAVADARAALGEDGFDAAWARGLTIKSQELVKLCEPGR